MKAFPSRVHLLSVLFCVLFSAAALAIDTDGDGVDDSVDAFPNDICASVDTDGDGKPDAYTTFCETIYSFANGTIAPLQGPGWMVEPFFGGKDDSYAASCDFQSAPPQVMQLTLTVPTSSTISFYYKNPQFSSSVFSNNPPTSKFYIDGSNWALPLSINTWTYYSKTLTPGTHTLKWQAACELVDVFGKTAYKNEVHIDVIKISSFTSPLIVDDDDDNDSTPDVSDKFPLNAAASSDADNDGFPGSWNAACDATCQSNSGLTMDNCPTTANANQLNTDGDTQGNVCDTDDDNDGVVDVSDRFPLDPTESVDADNDGTGNSADTDDDNDGMSDIWEVTYGFNPLINDASGDFDGDGITNLQEYINGSNPTIALTVKNDYNNDGIAGWIWQGVSNGNETQSQIWQLTLPLQSPNFSAPLRTYPPIFLDQANWNIVTTGDFNKDGDADIVWRNNNTAEWKIWQMQDGLRAAQNNLADFDIDHAWQVIGVGDTDKDGDDDIILGSSDTGYVMIWEMQAHAVVNTHNIGVKPGYTVNRIGDFNKDGDVDLLFRQNGGDALITWEIEQNAFVAERTLNSTGAGYSPVCAGDFDNDGDDDIMFINSSTQQEKWFVMESYTRTQQVGGINTGFVFLGCGDYDGDGDADSLWQRSADNMNRVVLQQNWGVTKQTVYTNPFGAANGFVYKGNNN